MLVLRVQTSVQQKLFPSSPEKKGEKRLLRKYRALTPIFVSSQCVRKCIALDNWKGPK